MLDWRMKIFLLAALLGLPASSALAAAAHSVAVELSNGRKTFKKVIRVVEDKDRFGVGTFGQPGEPTQELKFEAAVWPAARALSLKYRVGLYVPRRGMAEPIQMDDSGTVELASGSRVVVAECGAWRVTLSLDSGAAMAAWDAPGAANYRLTADASGRKWRQVCKHVGTPEEPVKITDGHYLNGKQEVFGVMVSPLQRRAAGFEVGYTLTNDTPWRPPLDARGVVTLAAGSKTAVEVNGYKVGLSLEVSAGAAASAPAPAPAAAAPAAQESGAVPLLR